MTSHDLPFAFPVLRGAAALSLALLAGCSDSADPSVALTGQAVYAERQPGGNSFACATCHALEEPASDDFRRPGHPIGDALRRPSFKNGQLSNPLEAVNSCLTEWMSAEPWTDDAREWTLLQGFLSDQDSGNGDAQALSFEITAPPADLSGGNKERGQELFNGSCAVCHGKDAAGTSQGPPLKGEFLLADYIAERVRHSGSAVSAIYPGLSGGKMPFWSASRLSDTELLDVVAFVMTAQGSDSGGVGGDTGSGGLSSTGGSSSTGGESSTGGLSSTGGGSSMRECASNHPKVGQTAILTPKFHGVSGTATIVDDCTIEITDFNYDGQGIVVDFYGGLSGDYTGGFGFGLELTRATPYEDEALTIQLPESRDLDDLDGLSVWCVDVFISFGDGMFEP